MNARPQPQAEESNIINQYDVQKLPPISDPAPDHHVNYLTHDTDIEVNVGDVIERAYSEKQQPNRCFVLEVEDHGMVVWDLSEGRYSYYPAEHLREDEETAELNVVSDPFMLRNAPSAHIDNNDQ